MVSGFFIVTPVELIGFLKYAGWSIADLQGRGTLEDVVTWIKAISELAERDRAQSDIGLGNKGGK